MLRCSWHRNSMIIGLTLRTRRFVERQNVPEGFIAVFGPVSPKVAFNPSMSRNNISLLPRSPEALRKIKPAPR